MDLNKEVWLKEDGLEFTKYLETLKRPEKVEWTKNICNTNIPLLALKTPDLRKYAKQIMKGNYISFLDLNLNKYYELLGIQGFIISNIKDFDIQKKYLDKYIVQVDCWALSDLLSFNINNREEYYYNLTLEYIKSEYPFKRRVGMSILFNYINNEDYIDKIFNLLDQFYNEDEYYVNMMNAWLLCECFTKQRDKTLEYIKHNNLNKFTINKAISKCRDSYRITKEDKDMLLKYKK